MWPTCTTFTFSRPKMLLQAHMAFSYRFFERETHNMVSGKAAKTVLGLVVWRVLLSFVLFVSMAPNWKAPISWKPRVVWLPIIPARNAQKGKQEFWIGQFLVGWYNLQVKPNIIFITYVYYCYRLPGFFANIRLCRCVYLYTWSSRFIPLVASSYVSVRWDYSMLNSWPVVELFSIYNNTYYIHAHAQIDY
jgi:hypothetical protein